MPQQRITRNPRGQVELNPQARPVDTFHSPIVEHQSDNTGAQLAQLANALGQLEPRLNDLFTTEAERDKQASILNGQAIVAKQQNIQAFRQAIKSGQIDYTQNPWLDVTVRQEVGRKVALDAQEQMQAAYEADPKLRYSKDVTGQDVAQFADKFLGQQIDGQDVWEAQAMAPVLQQAKHDLVQRHIAIRGRERVEELETSSKNEMSTLMGSVDATLLQQARDPNDPNHAAALAEYNAKLPQLRQKMQGKLNELLNVVPPQLANKWMKDAVFEGAVEREDAGFARDLWGSMTTEDGSTRVMNDSDKVSLRELDRRVQDQKMHRLEMSERLDNIQNKQIASSTLKTISQRAVAAIKNGQTFDYTKAISPEALAAMEPEAQQQVVNTVVAMQSARNSLQNQQQRQTVEDTVSKYGTDFVMNKLDPKATLSFIQVMMKNGGGGDLQQLASIQDRLANLAWTGSTNPSLVGSLTASIYDGHLTVKNGGIQQLTKLAEDKQLSQSDFSHFVTLMASVEHKDESEGSILSLAGSYTNRLDSLIELKALSTGQVSEERDIRSDITLNAIKDKAKLAFNNEIMALNHDEEFKKLPFREKQQKLSELLDAVAQQNGGFSQQGYEQYQAEQTRKAQEAAKQQQTAADKAPVPMADPVQDAARINGDPLFSKFRPADMAKAAELREKYRWLDVPAYTAQARELVQGAMSYVGLGLFTDNKPGGLLKLDEKRDNGQALQDVGGVKVNGKMPADRAMKLASYRPWYDPEEFVMNLRAAPDTKQITGHPLADLVNARMYQNPNRGRFGVVFDDFDIPDHSEYQGLALKGTTPTQKGYLNLQHFEITAFQETQKQAVELNQRLTTGRAQERYSDLLRASAKRDLTDSEAEEMGQLDRSLTALAFMRKHAGYTPDEVKQMGGEAWRTHMMFANKLDLTTRAADVARTLGLKDKQAVQDMITAQDNILNRVRDVRGNAK